MSLWTRSTPPDWIPSVATPHGYVSTETGELLVAFVNPLVLPGSGATITNIAFDREVYKSGDTMKIVVDFSQPVVVSGTPVLGLTIGSANVRATYIPSRSNAVARMHFYYLVKPTDSATAGNVTAGGAADPKASVVKQNVTYTAKAGGTGGNSITIAYVDPAAINAALSVGVSGSAITVNLATGAGTAASVVKQNVTYTAKTAGTAGNSITIAYVDPLANNQSLSVGVSGSAITVNLATGAGGAITSTNATVTAAITASGPANALVGSVIGGGHSGDVVTAFAAASLTSGANGAITSTNTTVTSAITASSPANALVSSVIGGGHASDVVTAFAAANLTGGAAGGNAAIASTLVEGQVTFTAQTAGRAGNTISVAFVNPGTANASLSVAVSSNAITVYLATNGSSVVTSTGGLIATAIGASGPAAALVATSLVSSGAAVVTPFATTFLANGYDAQDDSLDLQGGSIANAYPTPVAATLTAGSGNSGVVFTQVERGTVGNSATLLIQKGTVTPATLNLDNLLFTAATPGTTGNAVTVSVVNNNAVAASLTLGDVIFTAVKPGTNGNSITVAYIDPSAHSAQLGVSVVGTTIQIHLATDVSGAITTTSAQIVDAISGTYGIRSGASNLVTAVVTGGGETVTAESPTSLTSGANGVLGNNVSGNAITAIVATDSNGVPSTTAQAMVTYLLTVSGVTSLVTPSLVGNGTIFVQPTKSAISLSGGAEAVLSLTRTPYTQNFVLNLATTANSVSSTAGQVVTFINSLVPAAPAHPQNYFTAANVGNGSGTMATQTLTSFTSGSTSNLSANASYSGVSVTESEITVN